MLTIVTDLAEMKTATSPQSQLGLARIGVAIALASGCYSDLHGARRAPRMGDTSHAAARREVGTVDPVVRACTTASPIDQTASDLRRTPYLQRVTTSDAYVVWIAGSTGSATLFSTDGTELASLAAVPDPSAHPEGATQEYVHFAALAADTVYCFEVRENGKPVTQREGFRTAPAPDSGKPTRFIAWGDSGGANDDQRAVAAQLGTVDADLGLVVGDVAYEQGTRQQLEDTYFAIYKDLLGRLPVWPETGNHDYETEDAAPFREAFMLPGNERWFSYDWGDVHFVGLDTHAMGSEQRAWLERDLASTRAKWKVVYFHRPPYSSGEHGSSLDVRRLFGPAIEKYGVQLVLAGHDHDYERIKPQHGVAYFVTGGGGRSTRRVHTRRFTGFDLGVLHFLYVEAGGTQMVVHAIDATGVEFDSEVIPLTHG